MRHKEVTFIDDITGEEIDPNCVAHIGVNIGADTYVVDVDGNKLDEVLNKAQLADVVSDNHRVHPPEDLLERISRITPAEMRAWAQRKSLEVPARGRVPQAVSDAYIIALVGGYVDA